MTEPTTFLRLDATPPQKSPPPADAVDVFYDPEAASLKVQKPDGTTEEIGGGGASAWDGLTGTASKVPFDTTDTGPTALGELAWDSTNETLSLMLKSGTVLQVGEETLFHVVNNTGVTITDGTPVMYAGTDGNSGKLKIKPWDGTDATKFMGLATQNIPDDGSTGYVTRFGAVRGILTNGGNYGETWADGDIIYTKVGSSGLTKTVPTTGNYCIVGAVISAHASNGTLFVRQEFQKIVNSTDIQDSSAAGRTLLTAADAAAQRNALEVAASAPYFDVTASPYNAVADAKFGDGAVMTSGSATLTLSGANFASSGLPGKFIRVVGAGAAGADLVTTITSRDSTTQLTLSATAGTSVSSAQIFYGSDNSTAIQAALDAAYASTSVKTVLLPSGKYLCNVIGRPFVSIIGAGGALGQSAYNSTNLASDTANTFLLPALSSQAVIRYRYANGGCFGAEIRNIVFVGGDGTSSSDRFGNAVEFGDTSSTNSHAEGAGFKMAGCEVNGFNRGVTASSVWDFVLERNQFNFCNQGVYGGEITAGGAESATGPADGGTIISCGSNYTDVVFKWLGSKQISILCGDYNRYQKFVCADGSSVFVSNVNLEYGSVVDFHLVTGSGPSTLDVGYILNLNSTGDVGVWNERTDSNSVSWKFCNAQVVYKTPTTGYPKELPTDAIIKRYTSAALTTLRETEFWGTIARKSIESGDLLHLYEPFIKTAASPYGSLAWTAATISAGSSLGQESNSLKIYQSAGGQAVRLAPEYAPTSFVTNWRMRWRYVHSMGYSTTALRMGLYSYDGTAAMIPTNGIGMRADSVTAADSTVKLEVIVSGVIQSVVDTGIALSALNGTWDIILEKRGSVAYLTIKNLQTGVYAANQVSYSSTFPNSSGFATPAVFLSGSAAQLIYLKRMTFDELA